MDTYHQKSLDNPSAEEHQREAKFKDLETVTQEVQDILSTSPERRNKRIKY